MILYCTQSTKSSNVAYNDCKIQKLETQYNNNFLHMYASWPTKRKNNESITLFSSTNLARSGRPNWTKQKWTINKYFPSNRRERKMKMLESHSHEVLCFPLCRYAARGSVYVKHCNTEFRKQVFPRFRNPAPWKSWIASFGTEKSWKLWHAKAIYPEHGKYDHFIWA